MGGIAFSNAFVGVELWQCVWLGSLYPEVQEAGVIVSVALVVVFEWDVDCAAVVGWCAACCTIW